MTATSRRPTLEDVAREAGVSRALVSIVIRGAPGSSEQTRARVLAVAERLGYRPDTRARLLARTSARLLGVTYQVGALHHADLLGPIYEAAEKAGYELILSGRTRTHDERRALNTLLGYRCDAILLIGAALPEADLARVAATLPIVLVGRRMVRHVDVVDVIRTDEHAGMAFAVDHLAGLGHQRIAHIDGGAGEIAADRRRGYRWAMAAAGLRSEALIVAGGDTGEDGLRAVTTLLELTPRPTAVVCFNDECAWGVLRGLAMAGLAAPEDISVVGYDGSPLAQLAPRELTTVHQDVESLARLSVERAVARLGGAAWTEDAVVRPLALVTGETTARAVDFVIHRSSYS